MNPRPSGYEPEIRQVADLGLCVKGLAATGFFVLVVSRWSHTCSTISPSVKLSGLSRGTEGFSDLAPGDPGRSDCNDGVNDLMLTTGTSQRSTLEEVFLHRALVTFAWLILLETSGEFLGVVKDVS